MLRKFKRTTSIAMAIVMVVASVYGFSVTPAHASQPVRIQIDGQLLYIPANEQQPTIVGGRTLVPLRLVMEALGFRVAWDARIEAAILSEPRGGGMILIPIHRNLPSSGYTKGFAGSVINDNWYNVVGNMYTSNCNYANGIVIPLDVPPQIINGRTMVPLRAIAEIAGHEVDWDATTNTAIITTGGMLVRDYLTMHFRLPGTTSGQEITREQFYALVDGRRVMIGNSSYNASVFFNRWASGRAVLFIDTDADTPHGYVTIGWQSLNFGQRWGDNPPPWSFCYHARG